MWNNLKMIQFSILFSDATLQSTNGYKQAPSNTVCFLYTNIHVLRGGDSLAVSWGDVGLDSLGAGGCGWVGRSGFDEQKQWGQRREDGDRNLKPPSSDAPCQEAACWGPRGEIRSGINAGRHWKMKGSKGWSQANGATADGAINLSNARLLIEDPAGAVGALWRGLHAQAARIQEYLINSLFLPRVVGRASLWLSLSLTH